MGERGWQDQILDAVPSGIDVTQIEERLRLTPTERLDRMRRFLTALEEAKAHGGNRLPSSH
jgi:hypothetical protein